MFIIYKINFESGKIYIGRTSNLNRRKSQHKHDNKFKDNILEYVILEENLTYDESIKREEFFIDQLDAIKNGHNISPGRSIPFIGFSDHMKNKYANDPIFKDKMVKALHSNEEQRKQSLKSDTFRKIVSDRNKRLIVNGKSKLPIKRKPIYCLEAETIYSSSKIAGEKLNLCSRGIRRVASGERGSIHNHTFKFMDQL